MVRTPPYLRKENSHRPSCDDAGRPAISDGMSAGFNSLGQISLPSASSFLDVRQTEWASVVGRGNESGKALASIMIGGRFHLNGFIDTSR